MEQKFSSDLTSQARVMFEKRMGHPISTEQVEEFLDQARAFAQIRLRWDHRNRVAGDDVSDAA